jgi:hypothetical protein
MFTAGTIIVITCSFGGTPEQPEIATLTCVVPKESPLRDTDAALVAEVNDTIPGVPIMDQE